MKWLTVVLMLFLSMNVSFGIDILNPEVDCRTPDDQYMVLVGKISNSKELYLQVYQWEKINLPGQGEVDYPQPVTEGVQVLKKNTEKGIVYVDKRTHGSENELKIKISGEGTYKENHEEGTRLILKCDIR